MWLCDIFGWITDISSQKLILHSLKLYLVPEKDQGKKMVKKNDFLIKKYEIIQKNKIKYNSNFMYFKFI